MRSQLLLVSAIVEIGAGLGLLVVPALVVSVLLGEALDSTAAVVIARMAGAGILSLGIACARARTVGGRALVLAMTAYNLLAVAVFAHAYFQLGLRPPAVLAVALVHLGLAAWCLAALREA